MSNKTIAIFDDGGVNESCDIVHKSTAFKDTDIMIRDHDTGEIIFRTKNKIIIPGSGYFARQMFDLSGTEITPSYNEKLGLVTPSPTLTPQPEVNTKTSATQAYPKCVMFAIGSDGCGPEDSQIYPVNYTKWIPPASLVPFRYPVNTMDLSTALRSVYFGRSVIGSRVAYYFKRFDTDPVFVQQYTDGTPIASDVYDSVKAEDAESYVELVLKITKEDVREYFIATTGIGDAKINTVSLLTAWPKVVDGNIYWQDIRPLTKLNIANEPLIDVSKGIDIIYHIYV